MLPCLIEEHQLAVVYPYPFKLLPSSHSTYPNFPPSQPLCKAKLCYVMTQRLGTCIQSKPLGPTQPSQAQPQRMVRSVPFSACEESAWSSMGLSWVNNLKIVTHCKEEKQTFSAFLSTIVKTLKQNPKKLGNNYIITIIG